MSSTVRPGDALQIFAFADDCSFGILQSSAHRQWFVAKCPKLKSDFRYTPESGLPSSCPDPARLFTPDCLGAGSDAGPEATPH